MPDGPPMWKGDSGSRYFIARDGRLVEDLSNEAPIPWAPSSLDRPCHSASHDKPPSGMNGLSEVGHEGATRRLLRGLKLWALMDNLGERWDR